MWAVCVLLIIASVILVYQGMINLDGWLLGSAIVVALIALFALLFTGKGDNDDTN